MGVDAISDTVTVVWDDGFLRYDLGEHPLDPVRLELTMLLATQLGVLDPANVTVVSPEPASQQVLELVHDRAYIAAVRSAPDDPFLSGFGLNTADNPVFPDMHEASALVTGGTVLAAERVWRGEAQHSVNIAGGLHHAMRDHASGFCVYNDPAVAIATLLAAGARRIAYIDVDVHHGDGVQAAFWDDPRVLTVSLHQSPLSLFPGTGFAEEVGGEGAEGSAVNLPLPPGTDDAGWLRAFHAVVPSLLRRFRPELLVTQCGCDTHRRDPLADLALSVDGQRTIYATLHRLAHDLCDGRWLAVGGGGYGLVEVVPRSWTHLLAEVAGRPLDPATATPLAWQEVASARLPGTVPPTTMTDDADPAWRPWAMVGELGPLDSAILATRLSVFPLFGLDPQDPRD